MKKILFVGKEKTVNENFLREINNVFSGYLQIDYCFREDGKDALMGNVIKDADIILLTNPYSFPEARSYMMPNTKIITMEFTFRKNIVEALKNFPKGTEALVCFKFYSDAHHAAYTLYNLGVDNLNLYINYENNPNLVDKKMDLAIVSRDTSCAPDGIPVYFDVGTLSVAVSTMIDIAVTADILCEELESRIINHASLLATPEDHVSFFFDNSSMANAQLRTITNCIEYGIAIVNTNYSVINCNNQFKSMFNINRNISRLNVGDIYELSPYYSEISSKGEVSNKLIERPDKSKYFLFSKKKINKTDSATDIFMLLFKDITEIHALEETFQKQVIKKGHLAKYTFEDIVHKSDKMDDVIDRCKKLSKIEKPTLIIGESGTGKELFAHSIHNESNRKKFPFVALNCATIPATLLESELFGYEEGAFTGAKKGGKVGLFQTANKGTLFLDEIGEMTLETQAKLLRVLEEKEIMRVGGDEIIKIDTRVIAATNRNLKALVEEGTFRLDLYYRLNTLMISIPPLRERPQDIAELIQFFIESENASNIKISDELKNFFNTYKWNGNVRELRNCIEYMVNVCENSMDVTDLPEYLYEEYLSLESNAEQLKSKETSLELSYGEKKNLGLILRLIRDFSPGRRKLAEMLRAENIEMSEYSLREILGKLSDNMYIVFGKGRAGCSITDKGEELIELIETNDKNR